MLGHLLELRRRALQVIAVFFLLFLLFFFYANNLFYAFMKPLIHVLPQPSSLIATEITAPVLIPIQLAADAALLCTAPFALLHIWRFVIPGLYRQERIFLRTLAASLFFFCLGILFCFYLILPYMFQFFAKEVPFGVRLMPDISTNLSFINHMLLFFGLCFQLPLVCLILTRLKILTLSTLRKIRPYVIVVAFILGMLLTPDVASQTILAVPLCLLYELGIIFAKFLNRHDNSQRVVAYWNSKLR